jgi:hypothetical protein
VRLRIQREAQAVGDRRFYFDLPWNRWSDQRLLRVAGLEHRPVRKLKAVL